MQRKEYTSLLRKYVVGAKTVVDEFNKIGFALSSEDGNVYHGLNAVQAVTDRFTELFTQHVGQRYDDVLGVSTLHLFYKKTNTDVIIPRMLSYSTVGNYRNKRRINNQDSLDVGSYLQEMKIAVDSFIEKQLFSGVEDLFAALKLDLTTISEAYEKKLGKYLEQNPNPASQVTRA